MIYYFLPDPGIFGGVKVACQFLDMLSRLGAGGVAVIPKAVAPDWFRCRTPIISEDKARDRISESDFKMITWPPDYDRLSGWPGRMICHCQGTDKLMAPIFSDPKVPLLTCWKQAAHFVEQNFGRETQDVGISVSACFYFEGGVKYDNLVAYMPRRGYHVARRCMRRASFADFLPLHDLHEEDVAKRLKRAGVFLATAEGEQFGLPALEAMAAGCLVLSVPVKGGMEYLHDGVNCFVAPPEEISERLRWVMAKERSELRALVRMRAVRTALRYHPRYQKLQLRELLEKELSYLK